MDDFQYFSDFLCNNTSRYVVKFSIVTEKYKEFMVFTFTEKKNFLSVASYLSLGLILSDLWF